MSKKRLVLLVAVLGAVIAGLGVVLLTSNKPCGSYPTIEEVREAILDSSDLVGRIEAVRPGRVDVHETGVKNCPGRAFVVIQYTSEIDRPKIERLIGKDFRGLPFEMVNL